MRKQNTHLGEELWLTLGGRLHHIFTIRGVYTARNAQSWVQSRGLKGSWITKINKYLHLKAALDVRAARFIFKATCCRFCCPVEPWVILCLCLAACWEQKHAVLWSWSFLHLTAQIGAVMGVRTNYVSGWKSSYVTGVAVNVTAAAHPMGPESHWHGIMSVQKRFIFLSNTDFMPV